jgi:hypothetical protein
VSDDRVIDDDLLNQRDSRQGELTADRQGDGAVDPPDVRPPDQRLDQAERARLPAHAAATLNALIWRRSPSSGHASGPGPRHIVPPGNAGVPVDSIGL